MKPTSLTKLVNQYKQKPNNLILKEIVKHADKLGSSYLRKKMSYNEAENIWEESKSIVLTRSLERYRPDLNRQFSTYYIWEVRRELWIKLQYKNRKKRNAQIVSLNIPLRTEEGNKVFLEDVLTNFNSNVKHYFKNCIKKELTKINVDRIKNS